MQSDLLPSAWPVEEPSKDHSGNSAGFMLRQGYEEGRGGEGSRGETGVNGK